MRSDDSAHDDHEEQRADRDPVLAAQDVLWEYVERLNRGEAIDEAELRSKHAGVADEVLRQLEAFREIGDEEASSESHHLGTLGDYTLRRQIGRGGMGSVYDAWQNSMDRRVALKVLPRALAADTRAATRFIREAQIAGKLDHPNVVHVHGTGVEEQVPYYAMEFVDGETLAQILAGIKDAEPETETPFGLKDQVGYFAALSNAFADVADGLQHAHSKGVTHRDIKPSNLILDADGCLRILDFGLARLEGQESLTVSGDVVGTPLYMSPEQAQRKKIPVDHRTDVYSLGATMYEAVCGRPPFRGKDHADTLSQIMERDPVEPRKVNLRVPKDLETIVLKCLRKDSSDRYGTAEALAQDLRRFVRGDPVEARPQSKWERLVRRLRRHRTPLIVSSAVVIVGCVASWFSYQSWLLEFESDLKHYRREVRLAVAEIAAAEFSELDGPRSWAVGLVRGDVAEISRYSDEPERDSLSQTAKELAALVQFLPREPDAHYQLARAYRLLGETDLAEQALLRALGEDPEFVPAQFLLQEIDAATPAAGPIQAIEGAQTGGADPVALWIRAYHRLRRRDPSEALAAFEALLSWRGDEPFVGFLLEAHLTAGALHLHLGQNLPAGNRKNDGQSQAHFLKAAEQFIFAESRAPDSMEPRLLRAKTYLHLGSKALAADMFNQLFHDSPVDTRDRTALWISAVYSSFRDYESALDWANEIEAALVREYRTARLEMTRGEWGRATAAARELVQAGPDSLEAQLLLASLLLRQLSQTDRAIDAKTIVELTNVCRRAVDQDPQSTRLRLFIRTAWESLNNRRTTWEAEALKALEAFRDEFSFAGLAPGLAEPALPRVVCENFADGGDIDDCHPVCWGIPPDRAGRFTPTPEGLDVHSVNQKPGAASLHMEEVFSGDVAVYSSFSFNGPRELPIDRDHSPVVFLGLHFNRVAWTGYTAGVFSDGDFWYAGIQKWNCCCRNSTCVEKQRRPLDFDPTEHALEIELLTRDSLVEFRIWPAGDRRPSTPQVTIEDTTYRAGVACFFYADRSQNLPGRFYSFCVEELSR